MIYRPGGVLRFATTHLLLEPFGFPCCRPAHWRLAPMAQAQAAERAWQAKGTA